MRKHMLMLTTSAVILCSGAIAAIAQAPDPRYPNPEQGANNSPAAGAPVIPQGNPREEMMGGGGMMGRGMMGPGTMGRGRMGGGMGPGAMAPLMMRMMFALMDADGDGKLSLQEFQAAHERIFKAMDANKDGFVTLQEMQEFIRGASAPQQ